MAPEPIEVRVARDQRAKEIAESVLRNGELLSGIYASMQDDAPAVPLRQLQAEEQLRRTG